MRNLTVTIHVLVFALVLGIPSAVLAIPPPACDGGWKWIWEKDCKKWLPQFEITARPGNHDLYGMELDPFIPIAQSEDALVFLNVRGSLFWNHGNFSNEINVGGGYRRLMGDRSWILGSYAFYDFMDSQFDNHFHQGTLGIEALAWNWEARANGYIAEDDTEWAPGAESAGAFLVGNRLTLAGAIEQAMSGFDAEVGWRLPFFGEEGALSDTRLYAGGFWFDGSAVGSLGGPMTRFETRIWEVPFLPAESRLTLGTEYRWDDARKHQVTGLIAVRVPLGGATRSQPLTNVERRMTDRVVRDVSVVTDTSTQSTELVQTRAQLGTPGAVVGDAYFFDDDTEGVGSFEDPGEFDVLIDLGAENALLIGLDTTGDIDLGGGTNFLWDGQTVMGGGTDLRVWGVDSGQTAVFHAPGSPPTLQNIQFIGPSIQLAENNTISGLNFRDMGTALQLGLSGQSTKADISNNSFDTMATAVGVDVEDDSALTLYLEDNYFENMDTGLDLRASDSFDIALEVHRNVFEFMGTGLENTLQTDGDVGPSSFALNASENTLMALGHGIETSVTLSGGPGQDYTHAANLQGNDFLGIEEGDYQLEVRGNSTDAEVDIAVAMSGNHSTDGEVLVEVEVDDVPNGHVGVTVVDNEVEFASEDVIEIEINNGPDVDATIARNVIRFVAGIDDDMDEMIPTNADAIQVQISGSGDENGHDVTISENVIGGVENDGEGIEVVIRDSYHATVAVTDNELTAVDGDGIAVFFYDVGNEAGNTITIGGNTIIAANDDGIDVFVEGGEIGGGSDDIVVTVANNDLSLIGDSEWNSGIEVELRGVGHADGNTIDISQNIVHQVRGEEGIDVDVYEGLATALTLADNDLSLIEGDGIEVDFENVGDEDGNTIAIQRNIFEFIEDDGVDVDVRQGNDTMLTIVNNEFNFIGDNGDENGIEVDFDEVGHDVGNTIAINWNTMTNVYDDGVEVDVDDSYDTALAMAGNDISHVGDDGIDVYFDDNGSDVGNAITINGGNTVAFAEGDGIEVDVDGSAPDDTSVRIANNTIEHVGDDGIDIYFIDVVEGEVTVQGNVVDGSDDDGIDVDIYDSSNGNEVTIAGNQVSNSFRDGIDVYIGDGSDDNVVTIQSNLISHGEDDGIWVDIHDGSDGNQVTIASNQITDSLSDGLAIHVYESDSNVFTIQSNQISRTVMFDGIGIDLEDSDDNELVINGNTLSMLGDDGIYVEIDDAADNNLLQIGGNFIDLPDDDGIEIDGSAVATTRLSSEFNGSDVNNSVTNFGGDDVEFDVPTDLFDGTLLVNGVEVP